jgi:hypothetical protein
MVKNSRVARSLRLYRKGRVLTSLKLPAFLSVS